MPLYKKRKPNLKIFIQIPNVIYCEGMIECKVKIEINNNAFVSKSQLVLKVATNVC
jgi:hypothetical protein